MPRPRMMRRVGFRPDVTHFKPAGVRLAALSEVTLAFDEFEAVRLKDHEQTSQTDAAKKMNVSQPTFQRIISSARKKIAEALVNGKAIRIEGGNFRMVTPERRRMARRGGSPVLGAGRGAGRKGGNALGPEGICVCPECGHKATHQRGTPCSRRKCPACGGTMTRG
ncbi:MAG: DUF134 domain-containing protein [Candidatus Woesearchaeota archaeon]